MYKLLFQSEFWISWGCKDGHGSLAHCPLFRTCNLCTLHAMFCPLMKFLVGLHMFLMILHLWLLLLLLFMLLRMLPLLQGLHGLDV